MKSIFACWLLYVCIGQRLDDDQAFDLFSKRFGKQYATAVEKARRHKIFLENCQFISRHNAQANSSFTMGVNQFADMTATEFAAFTMGVTRSQSPLQPQPQPVGPLGARGSATAFDADIDWISKGAVTPVKNQGTVCGDCWAFSTTGSLEAAHFLATGQLLNFSEQQLLDCADSTWGNQGCTGGRVLNTFNYVQQNGLCRMEDYPYSGVQAQCASAECTPMIVGPSGHVIVSSHSEDALYQALSLMPVTIVIEADQKCFQFYQTGILTYNECPCGANGNLDHAVLLVGTGSQLGVGYWKVKKLLGIDVGGRGLRAVAARRGFSG